MTDRTICVTIDGQEIQCGSGCTVYEAATGAGIHIPTFCHHQKLVPVGACRMCLVEIEGARGLQTACTTPVRGGMVIKVHTSPAAVKARKANIEFLLTNHPLDCPVCDKGGECPLQDQALMDGPGESRYVEPKRHKNKRYPLGELIVLDQERCVLCWRCIRYLDEWAGDHELDLFGRGAETRLDTFPGRPLTSKWQGNTIDICPVGALTSRVFRFEARVWELTNTPSICPLCAVGCNIVLGEKNNELRRITPRENLQVNDAWICDKGRFAHGFVDHPDRLQRPLIRREGELQPATWDEALTLIARRLKEIVETHGPGAIAGLGSTRVTNEANYLFQRFLRSVIGTNNIDHLERMPAGVTPVPSLAGLEHKDAILLLGCDPSTEAPLVELWLKKAVLSHGARVLIASPRQIELGRYGGPWLGYRPGSEVALLNGLARAILDVGLSGQMARVTNLDEFRAWLKEYSPQQVERLTGVAPGALKEAAQILAGAKRPILLYGPNGVRTRPEHAGRTPALGVPAGRILDAIANLALLLGGIETGFVAWDNNTWGALEMGVMPNLYPGRQSFRDNKIRSRLASFWGGKLSPLEGLDFDAMMAAGQAGALQAMWIMGADPASDCQKAGHALGLVPFLVVQDLFMTDTASMAEVVLPAASFAETSGSFINLTGRLQAVRPAMRPPGLARPDWWIISEVARRMVDAKHRRGWEFSGPAEVMDEIAKVLPDWRGVNSETPGEMGWQPDLSTPRADGGTSRPATRRSFVLTEQGAASHDPNYPLTLVTGRLLYDRGTLLRHAGRIQKLVPEAFVLLHPADAQKLGLADGDKVAVTSASGRLGLTLKVSDQVVPGVALAPLNLSDAPLSVLVADRWTLPHVQIGK
jgi:NADH-quinone oxidoreductase subunit G